MRFLLDEMVPNSLGDYLRQRNHEVIRVQDVLAPGSPDWLIAQLASELDAMIVTWNRKHFRHLVTREYPRSMERYPGASLLLLRCRPSHVVQHVQQWIDRVEAEHIFREAQADRRVIVEIQETRFTIW